ncbi:MAG: arsenate reductase ArsC [Elusimicrobiota bacterium]|nr:arsenate reductase ArsC [Elusimicrobiota bacterium]
MSAARRPPVRVLFVCVENSSRSQMAEGFARKLGAGVLEPWSAGSRPSGKINETAIRAMKERDIELIAHSSKGFDVLPELPWDFVVTMGCGDQCPYVPSVETIDWNIPDPKTMPLDEFRRVRDLIEAQVSGLIRRVSERPT